MINIKRFHNRHIKIATAEISEASKQILLDIDKKLLEIYSNKNEDIDALADNEIKQQKFEFLFRYLKRIPFRERSINWSERYVQIFTYGGIKKERTRALNHRIVQKYISDNDNKKLESFKKRVKIASSGRSYTFHGLTVPLKDFNSDDLSNELYVVFDMLKSLGFEAFINSGTLLGAHRDSGFISYDDDIDIGIYFGESDAEKVIRSMIKLRSSLQLVNDSELKCELSPKSPILKLNLKSGVLLDIFPAWSENEKVFIWPYSFGELDLDSFLPFDKKRLGYNYFSCPRLVDQVLEQNYGPCWKVSDPNFKFDWELANQKFSVFKKFYNSVYKANAKLLRFEVFKNNIKIKVKNVLRKCIGVLKPSVRNF